jgi:hypothetical protein
MPPWSAAAGFGDFANDPTLTPHEIEMLALWADTGAPLGDAPPMAPAGAAAEAAEVPDLVLTGPLSPRGAETTRAFRLSTGLMNVRALRGWTFQPGNSSVSSAAIAFTPGKTLGTWVPGERPTFLPDGVTARLPARAPILLTVHYRPGATPGRDASRVGLYFADRPAREFAHLSLPCGTTRLGQSIDALAIRPIVGSFAWSLAVVARRPDGSIEPLGRFHNYPRDQAKTYWFRRGVRLPRGTAVTVGATHGTCGAELGYVSSRGRVSGRVSGSASDEDARRSAQKSGSPDAAGYWCPMHPNMRGAVPGTCSQCGMALVAVRPAIEGKYSLDVEWLRHRSRAGTMRFVVREPRTGTIARRFERLHERPFHLFVISDDLLEFSHLHPVPQQDGSFELSSVSLRSGPYQLYADFLPVGGTPQLIRKTIFPSRVAVGFSGSRAPHLVRESGKRADGSLRVRIDPDGGILIAGTPVLIAFHLEDAETGAAISDLQPYLGAWGHALIVSADLADAVHSHPITPLTSPGGPTIYFQQRFPRAGMYRLWAQFMRNGHLSTVSFTVEVAEPRPIT